MKRLVYSIVTDGRAKEFDVSTVSESETSVSLSPTWKIFSEATSGRDSASQAEKCKTLLTGGVIWYMIRGQGHTLKLDN